MITVKEYTEACKAFAKDTAEWDSVRPGQFYTTYGSKWRETSDNGHGGLDIEWAFHESDDYIEKNAPQEMIDYFEEIILGDVLDEALSRDDLYDLIKNFGVHKSIKNKGQIKEEPKQTPKKYFCGACDARFDAIPEKISGAVRCPKCGCYCCYEDTPEGSDQALKDLTAYENKLMLWEDDYDNAVVLDEDLSRDDLYDFIKEFGK